MPDAEEPGTATIRLSNNHEYYNKGLKDAQWGCGYRNTQVLCSSVDRHPLLKKHLPDGVPGLKKLVPELKPDYAPTVDARSLIIEFFPTTDTKTPFEGLIRVVQLYFCDALPSLPKNGEDITEHLRKQSEFRVNMDTCPPATTRHLPLYLQNPGHSYTIMGFEQTEAGEVNLIAFSPQPHSAVNAFTVGQETLQLPLVRLSAKNLSRHSGLQILMISDPKDPSQPCHSPDDQAARGRYAFCQLPARPAVPKRQ
ncbi:hypothetical protein H4R35_000659 [Dimargaris xerosporica]|nr:hypothetical protein H4R35_000659 [Dimargaris xerosporica]